MAMLGMHQPNAVSFASQPGNGQPTGLSELIYETTGSEC